MPIPSGFHTITPYFLIAQVDGAIEFYERAFAASRLLYMKDEEGDVLHCELKIGNSVLMLREAGHPMGNSFGALFLYVDDADLWFQRAVDAGARVLKSVEAHVEDGEKRGAVQDPYGITWWIATQIKDISREQMQAAFDANQANE